MEQKILMFEQSEDRYIRLAEVNIERGNLEGALGFLFGALEINRTPETLMDIADVYAQMGLYEISNRYWFYSLEKCPAYMLGSVYEQIAINCFYMDDFVSSSYYFHQKLSEDGVLSRYGLDQEIIDFFSGEEFKNNAYYVAYPFEKADYSYKAKRAKRALSVGNFLEAIKLYREIPAECLDEETAGDLSVSYLMANDPDASATVARESLAMHGENMTAYCNLSNVYNLKEDFEKSEYYYQKALSLSKGDKNEEYKLATCAIERNDHNTVKECLAKILSERKYDATMQFFYGLSLLNTGDFEGGRKAISYAYRLDPTDIIFKFYAEYASNLCAGGSREYLPAKYLKSLPDSLSKEYEKKLEALALTANKAHINLKKSQDRELVEWGLYCGEDVARKSVYILACDYSPYAKRTLKNYLMDNDGSTEIKQAILYALTVNGSTERLAIADRNFFFRKKAKKLKFEKEENCALYVCAYALAFSKMVFYGVEKLDQLAVKITEIYDKLNKIITKADATSDEIAGLAVYTCKFPRFSELSEVARVFGIKKDKLQQLMELMEK